MPITDLSCGESHVLTMKLLSLPSASSTSHSRDDELVRGTLGVFEMKTVSETLDLIYCKGGAQSLRIKTKTKLRGRSPQANYTDRATAACRPS
jgi:hypothetical protein